jgi:hypothetical protein
MLRQANCVKRITASGGGDLEAVTGKSYLIKAIYCNPSSNDTYLILRVDRKTVGVYRIGGRAGNHLSYWTEGNFKNNIMEFLTRQGVNVFIPIEEGQTFTVARYAETGEVVIVYDIYDAGDQRADMVNGSNSKQYFFMQYMDSTDTLTASGSVTIDTSLSPAEFPDFPCGKVVPARHTIELLGIAGSPVGDKTSGDNYFLSQYLKLVKDREVLFDEDRNGIPFFAKKPDEDEVMYRTTFSLIGDAVMNSYSQSHELLADPLMFNPPLKFTAGEELIVSIYMALTGSHTLTASIQSLAALLRVRVD